VSWKWVIAWIPALLGVVLKLLVSIIWPKDVPVLYLRGDVATLALLAGILLSSLASAFLYLIRRGEQRRADDVAEVQVRMAEERRQFLRRLDHELKNPLTAIQAGLANVASAPLPSLQQTALESVRSQTLRLSRLSADLRKLAELETRPLERTPVDMTELLGEVVGIARGRPEASERDLTLTVPQAPWPLPAIDGDPDLLFLAMHNLLTNALKFTQPGDRIEIRAFEDSAAIVVEIADTGPGIPEAEIPHVWEELYRGQGARGIPGSGLGLALVRAIAERHGGQVGLRSREGQGTVFTIRLPVA
jgi:two-component system OmpR family sensor kinase